MKIVVNGEQRELAAQTSVGDILRELQLHPEAVVIEVNTVILDRQTCSQHILSDGDRIEIIRFVGGG